MDAFGLVENAFAEIKSQLKAAELMMEAASADTVDEETRATAINRQLHPLDSSTPLLTAQRAANKAVAKLERKYGPLITQAMIGLLAIQQAKNFAGRIEEARNSSRTAKAEKNATGIFPETLRAIEILHEFGASKWHWDQQSRSQLEIHADLLRWHAKDPRREMADNPWRLLDAIYARRKMDDGKLSHTFGETEPVGLEAAGTGRPQLPELIHTLLDLKEYFAEEVILAPEEHSGTAGGVAIYPSATHKHIAMWERQDRSTPGVTATLMDWYRIEVPCGPYVLLQQPGSGSVFDKPKPEWLPPFKKLRQIGITSFMTPAEVGELEQLSDTGDGSTDLALKAIRHFTAKLNLNPKAQEHLTRFWFFLLVGRHHPLKIEALCPDGYLHGVAGPDPANHDGYAGSLVIVRARVFVANSEQLRPGLKSPWERGWVDASQKKDQIT